MLAATPAIEADHIRKVFGATVAVDDVSFSIASGAVHALLGENGAGKSTIVKLLSGLLSPDTGSFRVFATPAQLSSPRRAHQLGIQTAFQEMTLVRDLTVLESMLMPYAPVNGLGIIRRGHAEQDVARHLAELDLGDIDLHSRHSRYRPGVEAAHRDRPHTLSKTEDPAAGRADLVAFGPRRRVARQHHLARKGQGHHRRLHLTPHA